LYTASRFDGQYSLVTYFISIYGENKKKTHKTRFNLLPPPDFFILRFAILILNDRLQTALCMALSKFIERFPSRDWRSELHCVPAATTLTVEWMSDGPRAEQERGEGRGGEAAHCLLSSRNDVSVTVTVAPGRVHTNGKQIS
jgi:hypothetical protein